MDRVERVEPLAPLFLRILIFLLIPCVLTWVLLRHLEGSSRAERSSDRKRLMGDILHRVSLMGNPEQRFARLVDRLARLPLTSRALAARAYRLVKRERGALEISLFDPEGNPIPIPGLPTPPKTLSRRVIAGLLDPSVAVSPTMVTSFAGNPSALRIMAANPEVLVRVQNIWKKAFGGWWRIRTPRGRLTAIMVAFVNLDRIDRVRLMDRSVSEVARLVKGSFRIGWQDPAVPSVLRPRGGKWPKALSTAIDAVPTTRTELSFNGRENLLYTAFGGQRLFCLDLSPTPDSWYPALRWVTAGLGILATLVMVIISRIPSLRFGFRGKLIALLVSGAGILVAALFATAVIDRGNRETRLMEEFQERHLSMIEKLDWEFSTEALRQTRPFEEFARSVDGKPFSTLEKAMPDLARIVETWSPAIAAVGCFDPQRNPLFHAVSTKGTAVFGQKTGQSSLKMMANLILDELNIGKDFSRFTAYDRRILQGDRTLGNFYWIVRKNGKLQKQVFFDTPLFVFMELIHDPNREPHALIEVYLDRRYLENRFLRRMFREKSAPVGPETPRIAAIPVTKMARMRSFPSVRTGDSLLLREVVDKVITSQLPVHIKGKLAGTEYLITAARGGNLEDYVLFVAQPYVTISRETLMLNIRLGIFAGFILLLGFGIATLTSSRLLGPLEQVGIGLEAIEKREFQTPFAVQGISELERIGDRLAMIIAELKDIQIARSVQEHLWPEKPLEGDGWGIFGECRTATNLGGDFYDWFLLPDGKLVMAIGDVAGHGVPASLVTASAKMELAMNAEKSPDPAEILTLMNQGFNEQAGRFRPISFWLGIFDPQTRMLKASAAGHPSGILVQSDKESRNLGAPGYPLGSRKQAKFTNVEARLQPGARLFLYSDGLVEGQNPDGQQLGYERLQAFTLEAASISPSGSPGYLLDRVSEWCRKRIPDDDQTVVVFSVTGKSPGKETSR